MEKLKIKEFDMVILKTGEKAFIVDILSSGVYAADIGSGPEDWETILIDDKDIDRIITDE